MLNLYLYVYNHLFLPPLFLPFLPLPLLFYYYYSLYFSFASSDIAASSGKFPNILTLALNSFSMLGKSYELVHLYIKH